MLKIFCRVLLTFFFVFTHFSYALSCPFDEASIEITIFARKEILQKIENNNFAEASEKITEYKYLYEYFEKNSKKRLYQPLLDASNISDANQINRLLDLSLILEIDELLVQVDEMFDNYQKSRLRLVKAKKHLKAYTSDPEPMKIMKKILRSIGNPGLMGFGKKDPDKKEFDENKEKIVKFLYEKIAVE